MPKIQVTDRDGRPLKNVKVFVKWQSGISERYTDGAGIADLECSGGLIQYIQVNGEQVSGQIRVGDNDTIPVRAK